MNEASGTSAMDGKAARVAETEAGAEGIKSRRVRTCNVLIKAIQQTACKIVPLESLAVIPWNVTRLIRFSLRY